MTVVALTRDLLDRSKLTAVDGVVAVARPAAVAEHHPDVIYVDLTIDGGLAAALATDAAVIVAYGPHVDGDLLGAAADEPRVVTLPRSVFFRRLSDRTLPTG